MPSAQDLNRLLREAITLAQAGETDRARSMLYDIIAHQQDVPLAWLWLAAVETDQTQRIAALRRVLQLDPGNQRARDGLQALGVEPPEPESAPPPVGETPGDNTGAFDEDLFPVAGTAEPLDIPPPPPTNTRLLFTPAEWLAVGMMIVVAALILGSVVVYEEVINAPTATPTATNTFTPSPTFTPLPTNTPRPTRTPIPQATLPPPVTDTTTPPPLTSTPPPTFTPRPTSTPNAFELSMREAQRRVFGG